MLEVDRHPNVEVMSYSEVKSVSGVIGDFTVMVEHKPRYIDDVKCNGCGNCSTVCPVYAPNEFDCNIGPRKAIYKPFAQAVPNIVTIDMDHCIKCRLCVKACELEAINFDQRPKVTELHIGTIIVATGFEEYKPYGIYGYGEYENVITQNEFERLLAPNGPTLGHLRRISDDKAPKHIAVLQCVGSRDRTKNLHCSGYCCMVGIKNAKLAKLHDPDTEITVCYMDIRAAGKDLEEYYTRSRKHKIKYLRGNVSEVAEDPETKNLILTVEDTLSNQIKTIEADLVILSAAMVPGEGTVDIANLLKLERSPDGFIKEFHSRLSPIDTKVPGIYLAGACQGPKSVAETVASAKGAAAAASGPLITRKYEMELIKAIVDDERCSSCTLCVLSCPYDAITMDESGIAKVNEVRCRGCGTCSSVCLSSAITLRYYRDGQLEAYIDALLAQDVVTEKVAAEEEAGG